MALSDWESVQEWQASMMNLKKNSSSFSVNLKTDFNYIRCVKVELLSVFDFLLILVNLVVNYSCEWLRVFVLQSSKQI